MSRLIFVMEIVSVFVKLGTSLLNSDKLLASKDALQPRQGITCYNASNLSEVKTVLQYLRNKDLLQITFPLRNKPNYFATKLCNQSCLTGNGSNSGGTNVTRGL
jgi:hypothetical protein